MVSNSQGSITKDTSKDISRLYLNISICGTSKEDLI